MSKTKDTPTPLWWSETGALRCADHLPLPGSASWWSGNWTLLPPQDRERLTRLNDHAPACEICTTVAGTDAETAHTSYLAARVEVGRALTTLVNHLDALDSAEDIARTDWGFTGTLLHVAAALRDLAPSASTREDG